MRILIMRKRVLASLVATVVLWATLFAGVAGSQTVSDPSGDSVAEEPAIDPGSDPAEDTADDPVDDTVGPAESVGVQDSVVRLYLAVFARSPEDSGQTYWVGKYASGMSLNSIAEFFVESPEWDVTYGEVDDRRFVQLLYQNVLGRDPEQEGWDYWSAQLDRAQTRSQILLGFSESPEFIESTGTADPEQPRFPAIPDNSGHGRRIVYTNSGQRIWLINEDDTIHDSYAVSGRKNVPLVGTYHVYSKSPKAWAGHDGITMQHMVRFAWGRKLSIGFHSIPHYGNGEPMQTVEELGTFQSGGCVRQRDDQALALYEWAPIGTTVVVLA